MVESGLDDAACPFHSKGLLNYSFVNIVDGFELTQCSVAHQTTQRNGDGPPKCAQYIVRLDFTLYTGSSSSLLTIMVYSISTGRAQVSRVYAFVSYRDMMLKWASSLSVCHRNSDSRMVWKRGMLRITSLLRSQRLWRSGSRRHFQEKFLCISLVHGTHICEAGLQRYG